MHLWVVSHLDRSPGTVRVLDAAERAGHRVRLVHPLALTPGVGADGRVDLGEAPPDAVFTRMGGSSPEAGFATLDLLVAAGIPVVNDPAALRVARDKLRTAAALATAGIPLPRTLALAPTLDPALAARHCRERLGPPPWVTKDPVGAKGAEVHLVAGDAELAARLATAGERRLLVQEFVAEAAGTDLRVLVVGGRALAAMRRRAAPGEFRSNLHQGGSAEPVEPDAATAALAVRCAAALGLDVAGVDLVESLRGPLPLEVNGSPGFAGIEDATGRDLATPALALLATRLAR